MTEINNVLFYIERRLSAIDIINSDPKEINKIGDEIVIGVITKERAKKLIILSNKIERELGTLSLAFEKATDEVKKNVMFEMTKLTLIQEFIHAELGAMIFFDFPIVRNYIGPDCAVGIRLDYRIIVANPEMMKKIRELLTTRSMIHNFMQKPNLS